jgi:autotransporter-associated beta strand protein
MDLPSGGSISGTGSVTQAGSGKLTLAGNDTYTGPTNVALGTVQAGASTAFSASSAFTVPSVLDLNGFNNTIGSLSGNGTATNSGAATAMLAVGNNDTNTTFGGALDLADIPGPNETFFGPAVGHDSAMLTAGLSIQWTPMISTFVAYEGQLGRGQYSSNAVTGGVRVSW